MKALLIHTPAGGESKSWEFDPEDADNLEAERIETVGGEAWDSYGQWLDLMTRYNARAIRALLWILQLRTNPDCDFNEIRFRTSEVDLEIIEEPKPVGKDEAGDSDTDSPPPTLDSAASQNNDSGQLKSGSPL